MWHHLHVANSILVISTQRHAIIFYGDVVKDLTFKDKDLRLEDKDKHLWSEDKNKDL